MKRIYLGLVSGLLLLGAAVNTQHANAGEYEDRVTSHFIGEWNGNFKDHYGKYPDIDLTVSIEHLQVPQKLGFHKAPDEVKGTVTLEVEDQVIGGDITSLNFDHAYTMGRPSPERAYFSISFVTMSGQRGSISLSWPGLLQNPYTDLQLYGDEFEGYEGSLSKQ